MPNERVKKLTADGKQLTVKNKAVSPLRKRSEASGKQKADSLFVPVFTLDGTKSGALSLPKEIFGGPVNKPLLAQAMRVYLNNLKGHFGHTKTRSEVKGSTKKIRAQKGTGGARHGGIRAPIFVGGGIALGPKSRKVVLDLPQKMKQAALKSALADKFVSSEIVGITGLEKATGKTKQMQTLINKIAKKDILLVTNGENVNLKRAVRNLAGMKIILAKQLNAYEIIAHQTLMFSKEAIDKLSERIKS